MGELPAVYLCMIFRRQNLHPQQFYPADLFIQTEQPVHLLSQAGFWMLGEGYRLMALMISLCLSNHLVIAWLRNRTPRGRYRYS